MLWLYVYVDRNKNYYRKDTRENWKAPHGCIGVWFNKQAEGWPEEHRELSDIMGGITRHMDENKIRVINIMEEPDKTLIWLNILNDTVSIMRRGGNDECQ